MVAYVELIRRTLTTQKKGGESMHTYNAGLNSKGLALIAGARREAYKPVTQALKHHSDSFEDFTLNRYISSEGREYFEQPQKVSCPEIGMVIFLALQNASGKWIKETLWTYNEIQTIIARMKVEPAYEGGTDLNRVIQLHAGADPESARINKLREEARRSGGIVTNTGHWQPDLARIKETREQLRREYEADPNKDNGNMLWYLIGRCWRSNR